LKGLKSKGCKAKNKNNRVSHLNTHPNYFVASIEGMKLMKHVETHAKMVVVASKREEGSISDEMVVHQKELVCVLSQEGN